MAEVILNSYLTAEISKTFFIIPPSKNCLKSKYGNNIEEIDSKMKKIFD